jgi:hypothetical protein
MLCMYFQGGNQSNEDYKEKFDALWGIIEQLGGSLVAHPGLIMQRASESSAADGRLEPNNNDLETATSAVAAETKTCFILSGANNVRFRN